MPAHQLARMRRLFGLLQVLSPALAARAAFKLFLRTFRRPLLPEDAACLARATRHSLLAGSDPMTVYEWGSSGPLAIVLHGWGSSAARFTRLAEALHARGWHVVVPDAPGHGQSPGGSSSLPQFVAGLDALVSRFGTPEALVGHSLGALGVAYRHAASAAGAASDWPAQLRSVVLISMPSGAPFLVDVFVNALGLHPATRARLTHLFERRFAAGVEAYTSLPGASRIKGRLLVLHDAGDDIVPHAHSDELSRHLPAARFITTRSLGHSELTRDQGVIAQIVDFVEAQRL